MFRLPPGLWWEIFLVLSINILLYVSYHTGFSVWKMLRVPEWPTLAAKPLPSNLRRHVIMGLIAAGAMFLGSLDGVLQGGANFLSLLSLGLAVLLLASGAIRLFLGGSGRWHMVLALVALGVFAYRAALVFPALGQQVLSMGQPTAAATTTSKALDDTVRVQVSAAGSPQQLNGAQLQQGISLQGPATGSLPGKLRIQMQSVLLPPQAAQQAPGEVKGTADFYGPNGSLLYSGQMEGMIGTTGESEALLALKGQGKELGRYLEFVVIFPVASLQKGTSFTLYMHGEYVPKLQPGKFGSPMQLPSTSTGAPSGGGGGSSGGSSMQSGC